MIPRPETEHVIEVALERLGVEADAGSPRRREEFRIVDVGTGSGCIAVALAQELPAAHFTATDISAAALGVARRNSARHDVSARIEFIECNLLDALHHQSPATDHQSPLFDLIASNPPYIGRWESAGLAREVREYEPELALYGGERGTEIYARLIAQAASLLKPGGVLVLELGHTSAEHVAHLLRAHAWTNIAITNDLAGIPACCFRAARGLSNTGFSLWILIFAIRTGKATGWKPVLHEILISREGGAIMDETKNPWTVLDAGKARRFTKMNGSAWSIMAFWVPLVGRASTEQVHFPQNQAVTGVVPIDKNGNVILVGAVPVSVELL